MSSHNETLENQRSPSRKWPGLARSCLCLAFGLMFWSFSDSSALAAGCSYHNDEPATGLPNGVARIYEGGQFIYYQTIPPCSGPSCKKSNPSTLTMPTGTVTRDSNSLVLDLPSTQTQIRNDDSPFWSDLATRYRSPFEGEPLKPPV